LDQTNDYELREKEDSMKKKLVKLSLHRETVYSLTAAALAGAAAEPGSNPHSVCVTCSCVGCLNPTA
jgi:hypothetical protein